MATIGRNAGIADVEAFAGSGFVAWFSWLAVHIFVPIGFRNRLMVMLQRGWSVLWTFGVTTAPLEAAEAPDALDARPADEPAHEPPGGGAKESVLAPRDLRSFGT